MGKIKVLTLVLTKLDIELGLAQPQLVYNIIDNISKIFETWYNPFKGLIELIQAKEYGRLSTATSSHVSSVVNAKSPNTEEPIS